MVSDTQVELPCCEPKQVVFEKSPLSLSKVAELEKLFKLLGNQTRLRILHTLAQISELCVSDIAEAVDMKPQAVSNQLQKLVDSGILDTRRCGNQIYYRIIDSCVVTLLDRGICLLEGRCTED